MGRRPPYIKWRIPSKFPSCLAYLLGHLWRMTLEPFKTSNSINTKIILNFVLDSFYKGENIILNVYSQKLNNSMFNLVFLPCRNLSSYHPRFLVKTEAFFIVYHCIENEQRTFRIFFINSMLSYCYSELEFWCKAAINNVNMILKWT